jgi:hypothetical protein
VVSADPLYRQLAKLQGIQTEHEQSLVDLKNGGMTNFDRIVGVDTFEDFSSHYRQLILKELSVNEKKQFIQKFIKKVEVGIKTYKVHFIVDPEHYRRELALKKAGSGPLRAVPSDSSNFLSNFGSNTLTFGAPGRTWSSRIWP